ncbi:hypothetical protein KDA00_05660, partial [Candidatus Saccharibacteria bacterium]|nr:hypothetical protein [Candidatus Saccharibacteria bacterium]
TASTWLDNVKLKITGQIVGSHNITVESGSDLILEIASSNNGSSTPNGTVEATPETITVASNDSQPSTPVGIGKNQTVVVNGERGDITVSNKGTLKGSGTVGGVTVETGGTVAPGESPGCLNVGDTTFTSGSNFDVELGGTNVCTEYDQMVVTGTIDLGGATLNTSFVNGFTASSGQSFVIISNDGTEAVTGTFAGLAQGATVTVNGVNFTISYNGGDGNDVVLTFLSAPGTPDSGFEIIRLNPILTLITTTSLAGAIMIIHRKYGEINNK